MALYVKWKGILRGRATGWRLHESSRESSQALFVEVDVEAHEGLNANSQWDRIPEVHLQRCEICIVKADGTLMNENIESLMEALGWDGSATTIQHNPVLKNLPCQWSSMPEKDPKFFKGGFIRPYDFRPKGKGANPEGQTIADRFDTNYGSQLRAIAGTVKKSSAPDSTTTNEVSGSGPTNTPPAENPDADPPTHADLGAKPGGSQEFGGAALPEKEMKGFDEVPF